MIYLLMSISFGPGPRLSRPEAERVDRHRSRLTADVMGWPQKGDARLRPWPEAEALAHALDAPDRRPTRDGLAIDRHGAMGRS